MTGLLHDLRYALRELQRSPGFALTAVLTLALGIGATTAIFSAVYALLIRPLPYRDPDRLVWVTEHWPGVGGSGAIAEPDMMAWRERGRPFEAVAGYAFDEHTLTGSNEAVRVSVAMVTANFLSMLGATPQIGHDFVTGDDHPGGPTVALLSDALWRERFNADPGVLGTAIDLDGEAYTVMGILPRSFVFPETANAPQVLVTLRAPASSDFNLQEPLIMFQVIARIPADQSSVSVQKQLQSFQDARLRSYPTAFAGMAEGARMEVLPLQHHLAGDSRTPLLILLVAVGFVLLIACANIANLQLVRASARGHEIAVRSALGAGRARLARQFLTESMVVAGFATLVGLAVGAVSIKAIRGWHSPSLPWLDTVSLDPHVFWFTLVVAITAALLFGTAPAITTSSGNLMNLLKAASLRISGMRDHRRLRNSFVIAEIALALVLLIAGGLLVRSFRALVSVNPGYNPHNVLTANIQLPLARVAKNDPNQMPIPDYTGTLAFAAELLPRLRALPGVKYAGLSDELPLQHGNHEVTVVWSGAIPPPQSAWHEFSVPLISVSPDFFRAMGITIIQGRAFSDDDNGTSPGVVIVNQMFARTFMSGNALGKRLHSVVPERCAGCSVDKGAELQVVGIVADVHQQGPQQPTRPELYVPFVQSPPVSFSIALATNGNRGGLSRTLRSTVFALNHQVPVYDIATLEERLSESLAQRRLTMFLVAAFAVLALLLAAIGVYGVISYAVVQRTPEIGIRVALGAPRGGVLLLILRQHARMILLGEVVGLALATALSRFMSSLLFGVKPHDFSTFGFCAVILMLVALVACYIPARRAAKIEPMEALRYE